MILPDRKHPPHLPSLRSFSAILLVTVCTKNRRKLLANRNAYDLLLEAWNVYDDFSVGRYVVLPDHIHLFVGDNELAPRDLPHWVGAWKAYVSRRWPNQAEQPIWQRSFWDREIWSDQAYDAKWLYVRNNPIRHGLVKHSDDWPYQGVLNAVG